MWLGRLLADASVDPLAQQVDVTHVAGVLLDHSDQHLAQRHRPSTAAMLVQGIVAGDVETGRLGHEPRGEVHLRPPCLPRLRNHLGVGNSTIEITVTVGVGAEQPGTSCPAIISRNPLRSIPARCRTSPSSDIVDGSTERRAIASASRPAHFISNVRRWQRRASTSVVRSSPNLGPCSRGSSSDGLPSSVNMSARRVVAMAQSSAMRRAADNRLRHRAPMAATARPSLTPGDAAGVRVTSERQSACRHPAPARQPLRS